MNLLLVSDTHGKLKNLRTLLGRVKHADLLLHMGDAEGDEDEIRSFAGCPVEFVRGNCDTFSREPFDKVLDISGHRIFMTHGHRYGVGYSLDALCQAAREAGADIALFGHTHQPEQITDGELILVNPGSLSKPRQEGHKPTYALLEIDRQGKCHVTMNVLAP